MEIKIKQREQQSTLKAVETIQMSIEDSPEAKVMMFDSLITSYQHPIRTGVQEIVSNARDSHRVAGSKKAIDIQLPTNLNPEFSCRDYGTGIAPDNMSIFMTLFKSTKRSDNKLTGGFGLGCKSFYAYTDSFTVISFYNGEMRTYRASRAKNPLGELTLLSVVPTTEQNGIKIQVAVKPSDRQEFKNAVSRLMTYWKDQAINVLNDNAMDIQKPIHSYKNIELFEKNRYHNSSIEFVIDGVPYGIENLSSDAIIKFQQQLKKNVSIRIDNGVLELSKFREYIIVNESNKDKIHSILKQTTKTLTELKDSITKNLNYSKISEIDFKVFDLIFSYFNSCPISLMIDGKKVSARIDSAYNEKNLIIPLKNSDIHYTHISKYSSTRNTYSTYHLAKNDEIKIELDAKSKFYYVDQEISKNSLYKKVSNELQSGSSLKLISNIKKDPSSNRGIKVLEYMIPDKEINGILTFLEAKKVSDIVVEKTPSISLGTNSSSTVKREKALHRTGNYYNAFISHESLSMSRYGESVLLCPKKKETLFTNKTVYILDKDLFTKNADYDSKEYKKLVAQMSILKSFGYNIVYIPRSHESFFEGTKNLQSMDSIFSKKFAPTKEDLLVFKTFIKKQSIATLIKKDSYFKLIVKEKLSNSKELSLITQLLDKKYAVEYQDRVNLKEFSKHFTNMVNNGTMILSEAEKDMKPLLAIGEKYKFLNLFDRVRDEDKENLQVIINLIKTLNGVK